MAQNLLESAPPPTEDTVVGKEGRLTAAWKAWFLRMPDTLSAIPSRVNAVALSTQSASISSTDFAGGFLKAGLYRATYCARYGTGSLTVTFRWTDGGASQSSGFTGTTGTVLMRVDAGQPVYYSTSYVGAGTYNLDVILERVKA